MPNCDFYAVEEEHEQLLHWLLNEGTCRLFELYSDFETPLREFLTVRDVISQFSRTSGNGRKWDAVYLQLYVIGASPQFVPRRVELDPAACGGARFRYAAEGWGLVQLYLSVPGVDGLRNSHTNHNSLKRAKAWQSVDSDVDPVSSWDFKKISAFSSRLNRQVKKMSVAKIGSRPVLPGALKLWDAGIPLLPYSQNGSVMVERADAQPFSTDRRP